MFDWIWKYINYKKNPTPTVFSLLVCSDRDRAALVAQRWLQRTGCWMLEAMAPMFNQDPPCSFVWSGSIDFPSSLDWCISVRLISQSDCYTALWPVVVIKEGGRGGRAGSDEWGFPEWNWALSVMSHYWSHIHSNVFFSAFPRCISHSSPLCIKLPPPRLLPSPPFLTVRLCPSPLCNKHSALFLRCTKERREGDKQ